MFSRFLVGLGSLAALRYDPGGYGWTGGVALGVLGLFVALRAVGALQRWRGRRTLAGLRALDPIDFERAVASWFVREGFAVEHRGQPGDQGIDLVARRGGDLVAVQCKRYAADAVVRPAQVRDLYGAATALGATRALLVTTGGVAASADAWRQGLPEQPPRLELLCGAAVAAAARGKREGIAASSRRG